MGNIFRRWNLKKKFGCRLVKGSKGKEKNSGLLF